MEIVGGTVDGRYHVLSILGEGGMGAVYEARHVRTGRHVALKVIRAQVAKNHEMVRRFEREARLSGALETPHVVNVFDTGTDPTTGVIYMAMELLKGKDLQQVLKQCRKLRPNVALRLIAQACLGLAKAHEAGVLHRDIKPANIFLSHGSGGAITTKIVDFGIAKALLTRLEETSLTRTGGVLGSPHYMSPEQARASKNIDHRSDIWSLGVVLYQALTGRTPHVRQEAALELMMRICLQPAPSLQSFAPWVDPGLALIVHRMLSIKPEDRYQSATEVLAAMEPWLRNGLDVSDTELVAPTDEETAVIAPRASLPGDDITLRDGSDLLEQAALELELRSSGSLEEETATRPRVAPPADDVDDGAPTRTDYRAPSASFEAFTAIEAPAISTSSSVIELAPPGATVASDDTPQGVTSATTPAKRSRVHLLVALPMAFAIGVVGQLVYRNAHGSGAQTPATAITSAGSTPTAPSVAAMPSSDTAARSTPADERTVTVTIEPATATVEIDGQKAPVRNGLIELRGTLGSVHSVRVVSGAQETTAGVAITPVGAVPARMRIEPRLGPLPSAKPKGPAIDRKFE
ncbi:Serine/threonine protein kinase [Minicystis rosea]|nr:Serine/threonine protein kinase [Minicystis rosea]